MNWYSVAGLFRHELVQYMANKKQLSSLVVGALILLMSSGLALSAVIAEHEYLQSSPGSPSEGSQGYVDEAVPFREAGKVLLSFAVLFVCGVAPVTLGAASIVGEKEHRTLESLHLLPISDEEILLGKAVPAMLLPVVACWLCCIVVLISILFLLPSQSWHLLLSGELAATILLTAPAVAAMSVLWGIIPSVLVVDIKSTERLCILPALGLMAAFLALYAKVVIIEERSVLLVTLCLVAFDVLLFSIAMRLFNRERLLLRY